MAERTCSVSGCDRPVHGAGYCSKHWARWKRHGDPDIVLGPVLGPPTPCAVVDCWKPVFTAGWCQMHYQRVRVHGDLDRGRIVVPTIDRWWSHVDRNGPVPAERPDLGPCWLWTAALDVNGYGFFKVEGRMAKAHRWGWENLVAPVPPGHEVDHLCFVRACVNYERHLEPVTPAENMRRMRERKLGAQ